nr:hypothetical protein [Tanacetum cinerariifolium]
MSLDDLYNHLKVYESEVQKKSESNSQNMAFISSTGNTTCVSTASTNVPTASASVATISQDTACAYIASQSSGSQIKFEDINQIDEDDMEEMDIKWNMALLSMRADKFWKKTGKKISIQGLDVAETSKYWGVLRKLMISLRLIPLMSKGYVTMKAWLIIDARLHTTMTLDLVWMWLGGDYENVFLIEKGEHNIDFHPMVGFIEASPLRIITESSLKRNLKLQDEEGISSLPDTKLFENLTLMGYSISPNQKFTFQKGQFSHQWKYLIHTIMQCISPKSTGFNEFNSNIAIALVCLAIFQK